jgi:hypothetical protein
MDESIRKIVDSAKESLEAAERLGIREFHRLRPSVTARSLRSVLTKTSQKA